VALGRSADCPNSYFGRQAGVRPGRWQLSRSLAALGLIAFLAGCGGGGGSSSGGSSPPSGAPLTITTPPILPGTLQNHPYSVTLTATGGQGGLKWSIAPISPTTLFVDGLSINADTGVLSGIVNFSGTGGFTAQVTDSASHAANKSFTLTASSPLQAGPPLAYTESQFQDISYFVSVNSLAMGGVYPLTYTLTSACLPFGLRLDSATGNLLGSATTMGTYPCNVTIEDSYTPPEIVSGQLTLTIIPPSLSVANSLPQKILLNRPFSGRVIAIGGVPPYQFSLGSGSTIPPGLSSVDPSGGQISGTPTTVGSYFLTVNVQDSSAPAQTASANFSITVASPLGRNDTIATATPLLGNGSITASISPYVDPPDNAPLPADNDYYKLVSVGGAIVHVETQAQRWHPGETLDTVIEVLDAGGNPYSSCRQPGDNSTTFGSACVNDDIPVPTPTTDSALDFKVPGAANQATTFYAHVLDWRGSARPDMMYELDVSGLVAPLAIQSTQLLPAARGLSYSQPLSAANGTGNITWSVIAGALPPGLSLSAGAIAGMATTDGTYSFTLQAVDSANPPQTATAQETIQVAEPIKITSSPIMPDACLNQPYSFAVQTSGGVPPLVFSFVSTSWIGIISLDDSTGVFSGTPITMPGTFTGTMQVTDATRTYDTQQITLTLKQCP
jgi:large repetitive protein